MSKYVEYNAEIIESFANSLYSQARQIIVSYTFLGLFVGGIAGFFIAGVASRGNEMIAAIACALVVGLMALSSARAKAFSLKLQAQQALCNVAIEKNTKKLNGA